MDEQQVQEAKISESPCRLCGKHAVACICSFATGLDPWIGKRINEQYEIISLIARGGMGAVYRAKHLLLGSYRAIKIIRSDLHIDEIVYQRFYQEAKAVSGLSHPGIVSFHDMGIYESVPYVMMDLIEGQGLDEEISKHGPMEIKDAIGIFVQIAEALSYAHSKGIFHRDIKPSNIMLVTDENGQKSIRILDFGIAKIASEGDQKLTSTGEVFGSPPYMSPEQGKGGQIDERSDIYSLGCVMYETLMGQPPFKGSTALETIMKHATDPPPPLVQLHSKENNKLFPKVLSWITQTKAAYFSEGGKDALFQDMKAIVSRCLEKDPQKRYPSMSALASDLQRLNYGERLLHLQQEMVRAKTLKLLAKSYNRFLLACLILLIPGAWIYTNIFDDTVWTNELNAALSDPDTAYNTVQQLIVSLNPKKQTYASNKAYLTLIKGQLIRSQSNDDPVKLENAVDIYKQSLTLLADTKGGVAATLKASALEGLAQCEISLAKKSSNAEAQAKKLREIKDLDSPALQNNSFALALRYANTAETLRRSLFENALKAPLSSLEAKTPALNLAETYMLLADASEVWNAPSITRSHLTQAEQLIKKYAAANAWQMANILERLSINSLQQGNMVDARSLYLHAKAHWVALFGENSDELRQFDARIKKAQEAIKRNSNTR